MASSKFSAYLTKNVESLMAKAKKERGELICMHMSLEVSLAYLCTLKIFRHKTTTTPSVRFIGHIVSKRPKKSKLYFRHPVILFKKTSK